MDAGARVRDATLEDAAACAAVYAPYVSGTAISFEREPPSTEEMGARIAASLATHAWVVLEHDGRVVGYAYGAPFARREAYRFSCEVSVYIEAAHHGSGCGRALYEALFERLAARGYRSLAAGLTLPNEASAALHRAMAFEHVGTFRSIGFKHDSWHDVAWMQRLLGGEDPPAEPR